MINNYRILWNTIKLLAIFLTVSITSCADDSKSSEPPNENLSKAGYTILHRHIKDPLEIYEIALVNSGTGNIKKETRYNDEGKIEAVFMYQYSEKGRLAKLLLFRDSQLAQIDEIDDPNYYWTFEYNNNGYITGAQQYWYGEPGARDNFDYDRQQKLISTSKYGIELVDNLDAAIDHEYDGGGRLKKSAYFTRINHWVDEDGNPCMDIADGKGWFVYAAVPVYQDGRIATVQYFGEDGSLHSYDRYHYNEAGSLEKITTHGIDDELGYTVIFEYE